MGYTGAFVALYTDEPLVVLNELGEFEEDEPHVWSPGNGWHVLQLHGYELHDRLDEEWMARAAERTGSPVMVYAVSMSDFGKVRGCSPSGSWRGWLDLGSAVEDIVGQRETTYHDTSDGDGGGGGDYDEDYPMDHRLEWVGEAVEEFQRRRPDIALAAVRWAADAGRVVSVETVIELMASRVDAFVEEHFSELLIRLHIDQPATA